MVQMEKEAIKNRDSSKLLKIKKKRGKKKKKQHSTCWSAMLSRELKNRIKINLSVTAEKKKRNTTLIQNIKQMSTSKQVTPLTNVFG